MMESTNGNDETPSPEWRPLEAIQRRVLGVLIEKAKTTPDAYPLTLNAIKTGANQKSNRNPQMQLDADEIQEALDELRQIGAVVEVQGEGRVAKYRHKAYQWFGVDKTELAVITELLLRGEQTVGELRGRAARMESIDGLAALKPILSSLRQKKLLVEITPEGRGQTVTHGLYPSGKFPSTIKTRPDSESTENRIDSDPPASSVDPDRLAELAHQIESLTRRIVAIENQLANQ